MSAASIAEWISSKQAAPTTAVWKYAVILSAFLGACSYPVLPFTATQSLSVGEWSGTTSQGMPIDFSVSANETVTTITIGHNFGGCSGSQTFADLNIPTAPDLTCLPGPCSGVQASYRAFGFSNGARGSGPFTQINGLFLPSGQAQGQASFADFPGCGTAAAAEWTAVRR
jgi:hypothetical protein